MIVERDEHNPIMSPQTEHEWEGAGAFNWTPLSPIGDKILTKVLYRAQSISHLADGIRRSISTIGLAESTDGRHFNKHSQLITPEYDWERYGCEDPRVTTIDGVHYVFYTALSTYPFSAEGIHIGMAKYNSDMQLIDKHLITPFNAKAMALFPEKINGKFAALLTINTDIPPTPAEICYVEFPQESDMWSPKFWNEWYIHHLDHALPLRRNNNEQVELGSAPILTDEGWLVIYSHIENYGQEHTTFGIEAFLLDKNNPQTIIAKTKGALMVPEAYYEKVGQVGHILFPSGARIIGDVVEIFYSGTDTWSCIARITTKKLLDSMLGKTVLLTRSSNNPIISPRPDKAYETLGTINPAAVDIDGVVRILYRAADKDNISVLGYATSTDGIHIDTRLADPAYVPRTDFERHGCEDPRTTVIGDRVYMLYTAYDGTTPRVAMTSISVADLVAEQWSWGEPKIITLPSIANKDGCILSRQIKGEYMIIHRMDDMICADFIDSLDVENEPVRSCIPILEPRPGMWDSVRVGLACPPIETDKGWLMFYHGISKNSHYRVGVALLDKTDPTIVLARSVPPIFEPETEYEWKGLVPGVVFPCGAVLRGDTVFLYYGAADSVIGVATGSITEILNSLEM